MLSWALAFFIIAIISAVFGFSGVLGPSCSSIRAPAPHGFVCPEGMVCIAPKITPTVPEGFVCPAGWTCAPIPCGGPAEIAKILFVVFVVLFLVSLVAGLLRRP